MKCYEKLGSLLQDFCILYISLENSAFELVSVGTSCRNSYEFKGKTSLKGCADVCRASSTMFVHAFQGGTRCSSALGTCDCYCIVGATVYGTCNYYSNPNYKLYKYSDLKIPKITTTKITSTTGKEYINRLDIYWTKGLR